jgi:hypothetical protein
MQLPRPRQAGQHGPRELHEGARRDTTNDGDDLREKCHPDTVAPMAGRSAVQRPFTFI